MLSRSRRSLVCGHEELQRGAVKNPALHPKSRQEILDPIASTPTSSRTRDAEALRPAPLAKIEILPPRNSARRKRRAEYFAGTPDGSRPGNVRVNTGDFQNRLTLSIETTAYHEGIPAIIFGIDRPGAALASALPSAGASMSPYVEGWASTPSASAAMWASSRILRQLLRASPGDEMLRAIRLVADTGFHYKRWTREQVVFLPRSPGIEEVEVQSETDRRASRFPAGPRLQIGQLEVHRTARVSAEGAGREVRHPRLPRRGAGAGSLP